MLSQFYGGSTLSGKSSFYGGTKYGENWRTGWFKNYSSGGRFCPLRKPIFSTTWSFLLS